MSLVADTLRALYLAAAENKTPCRWRMSPGAWFELRKELGWTLAPFQESSGEYRGLPVEVIRGDGVRWCLDVDFGDGYSGPTDS